MNKEEAIKRFWELLEESDLKFFLKIMDLSVYLPPNYTPGPEEVSSSDIEIGVYILGDLERISIDLLHEIDELYIKEVFNSAKSLIIKKYENKLHYYGQVYKLLIFKYITSNETNTKTDRANCPRLIKVS